MIEFRNGYRGEFFCASGALAYTGDGWWFEQPWRFLGFLRPKEFTIITKTLTFLPRKGNLKHWCPWRSVSLISDGGVVNAVGLTNNGYQWWIDQCYPYIQSKSYNVFVSIAPENKEEAELMVKDLNKCKYIKGIELNVSCPNTKSKHQFEFICEITSYVVRQSKHPVILKLGVSQPYLEICKGLKDVVDAFDLINSVPWRDVYDKPSPLAKYGLVGGVSGRPIKTFARRALHDVVALRLPTPIISGGAIDNEEEVRLRFLAGASAISFGTIFIRAPWRPNKICKKFTKTDNRIL